MQERISCYLPKRPWTIIQVTSVHQDSNEYSEIQQSSVGNFLILMFPENNSTRVPSMAALSPLLENLLCVTYHKLYQNFLAEPVMQLWWLISLLNHKICLLYLLRSSVLYLCIEHFIQETNLLLYYLWQGQTFFLCLCTEHFYWLFPANRILHSFTHRKDDDVYMRK